MRVINTGIGRIDHIVANLKHPDRNIHILTEDHIFREQPQFEQRADSTGRI